MQVQKEGRQSIADDGFRPMPIPLTEWRYDRRAARVGTLHEAANTASPATVAAVPAHYWEDALRHSVYLTLVRDKIDQLITKGTGISKTRPEQYTKEVDDHDLWDKIKNAPFDRIRDDDHTSFGDVTIMAKGRLLEQNEGYRFTEDERSKEKCDDESCMEGVKAFWSVKRVRQRDEEPSTGKYHYELTFSVMSQAVKKQRRPFDNPVRTFTVRENPPDLGRSYQAQQFHEPSHPRSSSPRPQRAIWFHKNLSPSRYPQSLDRIFSSLFADDEPEPPRYRPNVYAPPQYTQHAKLGNTGASSEVHHQKKLMPYPYKPPTYKYVRPPLPPPPISNAPHYYPDIEPTVGNSFVTQPVDHRYVAPSNVIKTTRPAVLPTPPEPYIVTNTKNFSNNINNVQNSTETYTKEPEVNAYKIYSKPKPTAVKVSYFPDHLRPPVYNAPPGVFVTMDKKPFKPMPPLKLVHSSRPTKTRPIDFRPSPQLDNMEYSAPSDFTETAFRPILINSKETSNKTGSANNKKGDKHFRKNGVNSKKNQKKHENIKSQKTTTTSAPDIITAVHIDFDENDPPEWTNIVGAFTKTTPMEPQKEAGSSNFENMELLSSTTPLTTTKKRRVTSTTTTTTEPAVTTPKPTKRTRPPPKFTKPNKIKKHKRITTTTKPPPSAHTKPIEDLTPQASSAATKPNKGWEPQNKTISTASSVNVSTSTQPSTTEKLKLTTTTSPTTTTALPTKTTTRETTYKTPQPKNKNRFRQSTLMQKGTSVNHDKWSTTAEKEKNKTALPTSSKYNPRRKGSNFQGHMTTAKPKSDIDHKEEDHTDTRKSKIDVVQITSTSTQPTYEETADQYENNSELPSAHYSYDQEEEADDAEDEYVKPIVENANENVSNDDKEYIFDLTSIAPNEKANAILTPQEKVTEKTVTVTTLAAPKNKTKCKKKHHNLATTKESISESSIPKYEPTTTAATTTVKVSTELLNEFFGGFTFDEPTEKSIKSQTPPLSELDEEETEKHEKYVQIDDDFEDFLEELDKKEHQDSQDVEHYDEEEYEREPSDENFSPFDNKSEDESVRQNDDDAYDEYNDRSLSFLELMAME